MTQRKLVFLTVLVTAFAFLFISLASSRMWPHRYALGLPFVVATFCFFVGLLELENGRFKRSLRTGPAALASTSPWLFGTTLAWNLSALFLESSDSQSIFLLLSTALCLLTGLSLTISGYQWLNQGPAFQLQVSKGSDSSLSGASGANSQTPLNAFGLFACLIAALAIVQLGLAIHGIVMKQQKSWATLFFISELGDGRRGEELRTALTSFALMMFAFFLNFLTHHQQYALASVRLALYGSAVVAGIIGVGLWDLRSPLHFVFVALLSLSAMLAAGSPVPTLQGLRTLLICKWLVRLAFFTYGLLTVWMLWLPELRVPCIVAQRIAIAALLLWFLRLWGIIVADSLPHRRG